MPVSNTEDTSRAPHKESVEVAQWNQRDHTALEQGADQPDRYPHDLADRRERDSCTAPKVEPAARTERRPMAFETVFSAAYARNNKAKNAKRMRCFPACAPCGHIVRGFCGSNVSLLASASDDGPTDLQVCYGNPSSAFAVGCITECTDGSCPYIVGQRVPYAEIRQSMHSNLQTPADDGSGVARPEPKYFSTEITAASDSSLRVEVSPHKGCIWRYGVTEPARDE